MIIMTNLVSIRVIHKDIFRNNMEFENFKCISKKIKTHIIPDSFDWTHDNSSPFITYYLLANAIYWQMTESGDRRHALTIAQRI